MNLFIAVTMGLSSTFIILAVDNLLDFHLNWKDRVLTLMPIVFSLILMQVSGFIVGYLTSENHHKHLFTPTSSITQGIWV